MKNITVLGAGSFGIALSSLLLDKGYCVKIWTNSSDEANMINTEKEQKEKLPGVKLKDSVKCYTNIAEAMENADMVVVAIPSKFIRSVAKQVSPYVKKDMIIVTVAKGIEESTLTRLSEVIASEVPQARVAVLSGPSHAEEVGRKIPTTIVAASKHAGVANIVQDVFMTEYLRVYTNSDVIGVEIGGALKNVIALCAGVADGLELGDNTKAALISRGVSEITRLGVKMGANAKTFSGLTCMGDLVVTCMSMHSRNRRAGILIGKGYTVSQALDEVKMVVEGVQNTKAAYELAQKYDVEMPIVKEAYEVIFNNKSPKVALKDLMTRGKKEEM